jgi:hypothetical protein
MSRRRSGRHEEFSRLILVVDCFQRRWEGSAGDDTDTGGSGVVVAFDWLQVRTRGGHQRELRRRGNISVQERGRGAVGTHRISVIWAAAIADSNSLICFETRVELD